MDMDRLEQWLRREEIGLGELHEAMESADPVENAVAYHVLTGHRGRMAGFVPSVRYPEFLLGYLIGRVLADGEGGDLLHGRAEALLELRVPLDPYWHACGVGIEPEVYWAKTEAMCRALYPAYVDAIVTHWLEGCPKVPGFAEAMKNWAKRPQTRTYVAAVSEIIGGRSRIKCR